LSDTYSFQIYSSVQQLPASWDELAARNVFLSSEYLAIAEKSAEHDLPFYRYFQRISTSWDRNLAIYKLK
jgi:hypothetical protein